MELEIRPKDLIGMEEDEAWDAIWEEIKNKYELASCDKCGVILHSNDLLWINSDSFIPKEGEVVSPVLFEEYDTLCEKCYKGEVYNEDYKTKTNIEEDSDTSDGQDRS